MKGNETSEMRNVLSRLHAVFMGYLKSLDKENSRLIHKKNRNYKRRIINGSYVLGQGFTKEEPLQKKSVGLVDLDISQWNTCDTVKVWWCAITGENERRRKGLSCLILLAAWEIWGEKNARGPTLPSRLLSETPPFGGCWCKTFEIYYVARVSFCYRDP
jgi:hypothetical protein